MAVNQADWNSIELVEKSGEGWGMNSQRIDQITYPKPKNVIAWTGGSRPAKPSAISTLQAGLQKYLFQEQVETFRKYWGDSPNWDTLRIFFGRARYDAHASTRD